jgi:hypothetical protein
MCNVLDHVEHENIYTKYLAPKPPTVQHDDRAETSTLFFLLPHSAKTEHAVFFFTTEHAVEN